MKNLALAISLTAGLLIAGSSLTQAQGGAATYDDNNKDNDKIEKQCTFFDKIVFVVKDYYNKDVWYDIKIIEKDALKSSTNVTDAVIQFCKKYPGDPACKAIAGAKWEFTIKDVDFAVVCKNGESGKS